MKRRILKGLRRVGVSLLSAIFILSAPLAVLASEPGETSEEIVLEQEAQGEVEPEDVEPEDVEPEDVEPEDVEPEEVVPEVTVPEDEQLPLADIEDSPTAIEKLELTDEVYFMGAMTGTQSETSLDENTVSQVNTEFDEAVRKQAEEVNLAGYDIPKEDAGTLTADFLNRNPQYFYVDEVSVEYDEETEIITTVYFRYLSEASEKQVRYEQKVAEILAGLDDSWSDVEKLFYLHDYIVTHCQYDLTLNDHTAYGCLVDGCTVCQGYALAFMDLANRVGINTEYVSSGNINHAWNLVELNGKHYFVDCTWDDPTGTSDGTKCHWYEANCKHVHFLKSQDALDATHSGSMTTASDIRTNQGNIYGLYNDHEFDDVDWKNSNSPVGCMSDGIIYLKSNGDICRSSGDFYTGTKLTAISGRYGVFDKPGYYYTSTYGTLINLGDSVFLNTYNEIYRLDLTANTVESIYNLNATELNTGYIFGMRGQGTSLTYSLSTNVYDISKTGEASLDVSGYMGETVSSVELNKSFITFSRAGQTETLTATVKPSSFAVESWTSANPEVATVSSTGKVTAVAPGLTRIIAKSGRKQAVCMVSFNTSWQDDFSYEINKNYNYIEIDQYKGSAKKVTIPAKAVINGMEYPTRIRGFIITEQTATSTSYSYYGVFVDNNTVEEITVEDGVLYYPYMYKIFHNCTALKKVDLSGSNMSVVNTMSYVFRGCTKLEEVDLSGCDMGNVTSATQVFAQCSSLNTIKTPKAIYSSSGFDFPSGVKLKELTSSGVGTTEYTSLKNAPLNSTLIVQPTSPKPVLTKTDNGVKIAWDAQPGVSKYRIYRKTADTSWITVKVVSGTEYLDTSAVLGNEYTYLLRCVSADGKVLISTFDSKKATTILYANPVSPKPVLTKTDNGVKVTWDAQSGVSKYRIYRKTADTSWITVAVVSGTEYLDASAVLGNEYTYLMRCVSADGKSLISDFDSKKSTTILYANPVSPKPVLTKTDNGVKISWDAQAGVTRFRIYRKTADTSWITVAVTTGTEYLDTSAELGNEYTYLMRCVSADGKSLISAFDSSKSTVILYANPVSPTPVLSKTAKGVQITWAAEPGVTKYRIYRKTATSDWVTVTITGGTSYTDASCTPGTTYTYLMRCVSSDGKSLISAFDSKKARTIEY